MKVNEEEARNGKRWFFGAGAFAILLAISLWQIDDYLTYSDRDEVLGEVLYELRSAQTSLGAGVTDTRQTGHIAVNHELSDRDIDNN